MKESLSLFLVCKSSSLGDIIHVGYLDSSSEIRPTKLTKAYMLAAAYCSTFGGTGTLVGTGTNLTFKGIYESTFPQAEGITFTSWMISSFPQMVCNSFLTWLYLRIGYMGYLRPQSKDAKLATIGPEGEAVTNRVKSNEITVSSYYRSADLLLLFFFFFFTRFVNLENRLDTRIYCSFKFPCYI